MLDTETGRPIYRLELADRLARLPTLAELPVTLPVVDECGNVIGQAVNFRFVRDHASDFLYCEVLTMPSETERREAANDAHRRYKCPVCHKQYDPATFQNPPAARRMVPVHVHANSATRATCQGSGRSPIVEDTRAAEWEGLASKETVESVGKAVERVSEAGGEPAADVSEKTREQGEAEPAEVKEKVE